MPKLKSGERIKQLLNKLVIKCRRESLISAKKEYPLLKLIKQAVISIEQNAYFCVLCEEEIKELDIFCKLNHCIKCSILMLEENNKELSTLNTLTKKPKEQE